jgi:hypothetical protein
MGKKSAKTKDRCRNHQESESRLIPSIGENAYQIAASELKYSQAERLVKNILGQNAQSYNVDNEELNTKIDVLKGKGNDSFVEIKCTKELGKKEKMQEAIKATINKIENKLNNFQGKFTKFFAKCVIVGP